VAPSNDDNNTCSADQILTQNMRAGARNGKFHPYTKAIVKEVKILQAHMNRLGFNSGPEDGILGKLTDGAIKRMQVYLGTKADGLVGPITRALINKSCGDAGLQKTL
jgi:murein L,D-transpeptidase YcbB/YkuD